MKHFWLLLLFVFVLVRVQADELTFSAAPEYRPVVSVLYYAMTGAEPRFVDTGAAIEATAEVTDIPEDTYVYILPDTALVLREDNADAQAFLAFAISPDGQMVLVDGGYLPETLTITDQAGNVVTVPQPVYRTVCPYSLVTYMIYAVGAGDTMVAAGYLGVNDPRGAAAMERIDPRFPELNVYGLSQNNANVEEIALLDPDIVLSSARSDVLDPIIELGVPILRYEGETLERLQEAMRMTASLYGPNAMHRAELWIDYYDQVLATVRESAASTEKTPRVLFTGTQATRVASGSMYQSAMIEAAGGESVTADLSGYWNDANMEQILIWDPDVIFVPQYGAASVEAILEDPTWQLLDAVQAGRVYLVPRLVAPWDTPAPDSVLGIIWMAGILHPDRFELDCAEETHTFYNRFYGYAISDDEVAVLCGI